MKLSRIFEILGGPTGRHIQSGGGKTGTRRVISMLTWVCFEEPGCEPSCVARNPAVMDFPAITDNGLWTIEPCRRHAALFENEDLG